MKWKTIFLIAIAINVCIIPEQVSKDLNFKPKIGIIGCAGRQGKILIRKLSESSDCMLSEGCVNKNGKGNDLGEIAGMQALHKIATTNAEEVFKSSDVVIDFTNPKSTLVHIELAKKYKKPLVIGTSGFSMDEQKYILEQGKYIPIFLGSEMSTGFTKGMTLLLHLAEEAATYLDDSFDAEIIDTIHRYKKDAPSGAAKSLAAAIQKGRRNNNETLYELNKNQLRKKGSVGVASVRGGQELGTHAVCFFGDDDVIELKHEAKNKDTYANGAITASLWIHNRAPGIYTMRDVLNLKKKKS